MSDRGRREVLRWVGAAGAAGLAGCPATDPESTGEPSDDPTTTGRTTEDDETTGGTTAETTATEQASTEESTTTEGTTTPSPSADLAVRVVAEDGSRVLVVEGTVSAPAGLQTVEVATAGESVRIDAEGGTDRSVDAELQVDGGRSYEIEVRVVDEEGTWIEETLETGRVPVAIDAMEVDRLVGAHYYPWYEMHAGHRNWTDRAPSEPVLGEYAADDPTVVERHVKWCLDHGIRWLSMSWWGPGSGTDRALEDTVLETPGFEDVSFSILYETLGRLGEFSYDLDDPAARARLGDDLAYLEETYFGRENYLHLDGRPVVFFYISNNLAGDVEAAFDAAAERLAVEPYVLADVPFGTPLETYPVSRVADGVTAYNPYAPRPDIEDVFHDRYEHGNKVMHLGAEAADVDFVPVAIPGFNDTHIPDSQREDHPVLSSSPERYERVCEQVAPHLGDAEAVLVTSFNEWYENTQVEPSETHGTAYLELTAERLASGSTPAFDPAGSTLRLEFNRTISPASTDPDSTDARELAFMLDALRLYDGGDEIRSFDVGVPASEPLFLGGAFGTESGGGDTWRWLGGHAAETTLFVEGDVADADRAELVGQPMRSDEIEATVYFDGTRTDHVAFGDRDGFEAYDLSLTG